MILSGHYQMSLAPLGGWTPMVGHMILSGHYHMSLAPLEGLNPYGGTFDIVWTLSFVPGTFGEAGPLWRDI